MAAAACGRQFGNEDVERLGLVRISIPRLTTLTVLDGRLQVDPRSWER